MTGSGALSGYPAEASLTFSGAEAYGEVLIEGPEAWQAAIADAQERAGDLITSFALVSGDARLENLDGGIGRTDDGRYRVTLRFRLPQSRENLVLHPVYEDTRLDMSEGIALN